MRRPLVAVLLVTATLAAPALARAQAAPVTWCGSDEVGANRVPDLEVAEQEQVRFVYAIPSDGADNFAATASGIATDAAAIDGWWEAQDPTRTPRFDRYAFPGCATKYGALDIGFARLPNPASWYSAPQTPGRRLDLDLRLTMSATQKTIVYYDGPISSPTVCGETDYLADTRGGENGIVYVYLQSSCELGAPGAGRTAEVAAHELLHNLGAVPGDAPNECPTSEGHVCDSATDIMYPFLADGSTLDSVVLDLNRNDYYGHSGPFWDVQDSAWLTRLPQYPFSLAVSGSGTLSSSLPCDTGCASLPLDNGERVSVNAVPEPGWKFASWSGGCAGAATCDFEIDGPTTATATFVRATVRVSVTVAGRGRVTSSPAGVACSASCRATVVATRVRLTAVAAPGWRFAGWSGACRGTGTCTVDASGAVRVRFARR